MKKIFIALLMIIAISCTKSIDYTKVCYRCELSGGIPYQSGVIKTVCLDPWETPGNFQDANGNDLNSFCTKQ